MASFGFAITSFAKGPTRRLDYMFMYMYLHLPLMYPRVTVQFINTRH